MKVRVRPYSANIRELDSRTQAQPVRPVTAGSHFRKHASRPLPTKFSKSRLSTRNQSLNTPTMSVVRPKSSLERADIYKKVLVDSVHRIHCPTLYRALCKVEKSLQLNKKLRYAFAKMLYLAAVRGEYNYDDIQDHVRDSLQVFVSSSESRQLVLYAGIFSTYHQYSGKAIIDEIRGASDMDSAAAAALEEDMRACVKGVPLSVPPLYCYTKWSKDVKKLESRRHLSPGFFTGPRRHGTVRIAVMGQGCDGSDCGGSQATFEEVIQGDLEELLGAASLLSMRSGAGLKAMNSDDDDDFAPLPVPKKVSKLSKFKKIAYGVMMALPSDEKDVLQNATLQRKKGLQYLYESGHNKNPEHQRMIASLIRGENPSKNKPKGGVVDSGEGLDADPDDENIIKSSSGGGVGIVVTDDIAAGYYSGNRSPSSIPSSPNMSSETALCTRRPFSFRGTARTCPANIGSPLLDSSSGEMSPVMGTRSKRCQSFDSQLDWSNLQHTSQPQGAGICPNQEGIIVDSIPSSVPPPQAKQRIGPSLRKVSINEPGKYAPPTPGPLMQFKVCATVGLAKIQLLRKSSIFKGRKQEQAVTEAKVDKGVNGKDSSDRDPDMRLSPYRATSLVGVV